MKIIPLSLLSIAIVFFIFSPQLVKGAVNDEKDRYLLAFDSTIDYQLIHNFEGEIIKEYEYMPVVLVEFSKKSASSISKESDILYIEKDGEVTITSLTQAESSTQTIPWNIDKVNNSFTHPDGYKGTGIKVGIIDTGIDYTHSDLKVAGGVNFVEESIDFKDDHSHGTVVAGIIAALDNSQGIIGIAPEAELYAIKALNSKGKGSISDIVLGIEWAIEHKINIINLSLSTDTHSKTLAKAIKEADKNGILLVSAAGNKGYAEKSSITYPAAYNQVIAVGAIDINNVKAPFSSVGSELDLVAPGKDVYSTTLNGQYSTVNGTSISAPHVVGVATLLWGEYPQLSNKQIKSILNRTALNLGDKYLFGNGLVDAYEAFHSF